MTDEPRETRSQRNRRLKALGIGVADIPVYWNRLIDAMIYNGDLTDAESRNRGCVIAKIAEHLAQWHNVSPEDIEVLKAAGRVARRRRKRA
jgi:hypothetical protein